MKKKMGRPKKEIDFIMLEKLCGIMCTLREISNFFECSEDTIERRIMDEFGITFAEYYNQKKVHGKISIRRSQFQLAMKGNATMLIWLGKNHLDQKDKQELDHKSSDKSMTPIINFIEK